MIITLNGRAMSREEAIETVEDFLKSRKGVVMQKVKLENGSGDLVAELEIPAFTAAPEVIIWGNRVFMHELGSDNTYTEAFAYVVPNAA
jgi:hypothetical protein